LPAQQSREEILVVPAAGNDLVPPTRDRHGAEAPVPAQFSKPSANARSLDKIDKTCRKMEPLYGAGWVMRFERPETQVFEMKVRRSFFRDFFARHDATLAATVMCAFDVN
jgi:hypothetical protein